MGHDSQVPREERQEESLTALSRQPKTCSDVVLNWLRLYAAMPYMREKAEQEKWNWEEIILFYDSSLGKLTHPLAMHRAFEWHRDHTKWLPQPCEVLEAYQHELGKIRAEENQRRERIELCGDCRGTGWKMVNRSDGKGQCAVSCDCRKKKTA